MPTVPTINRQVQTAQLPNAQVNYQAFNPAAPAAQALGGIAQQAFGIAMEQKEDADRLAVQDAINQVDAFETKMYDPQSGIYSRKGKDALKLTDEVSEQYEKLAGSLYDGLANDTQRQIFNEFKQQRQRQILNSVQRYALGEYESYADQQYQTTLQNAQQLAIENYAQPERVDAEINKVFTAVLEQARRKGYSPEQTQFEARSAVSSLHVGVISRMIQDSPLTAKAYFDANRDEIFGEDELRTEELINTKAKAYEADAMVDEIIGTSEQKLSDWLKRANEIDDPEMKSMVRDTLRARFNDVKIAEQELVEQAFTAIEQGQDPRKQDWWVDIPASQRGAMENRYRQVREGIQPVTDDALLLQLRGQSQQEWAAMTQAELLSNRDKLDDAAWNLVQSRWEVAKEAARNPDKALQFAGFQTTEQRIRNAATLSGFLPDNKKITELKGDEAKRYMQFNNAIETRLQAETFERGRKLTATEEQAIIDDEVRKTVFTERPGWFSGAEEVPISAIIEGDEPYYPYERIPDSDKLMYRQYVEQQGWVKGDFDERLARAYPYLMQGNKQAAMMILKGNN